MTNPSKPQKSKEFIMTRRVMADYIVMLTALSIVSVFSYGEKAAMLTAVSVLTCLIARKIGALIFKSDEPVEYFSSIVTGFSIALLMPASAAWWMVVFAGIFAVLVCVIPFGNSGKAPFVPAAAAICFMSVCFGEELFSYPKIGLGSYFEAGEAGVSITKMLSQNNSIGVNTASFLEVLNGNIPAAIGAGSVVALIGALIYLIIRRPKNCVSVLSFLFSAGLVAVIFPRVGTGRGVSLLMELSGGMLLFSAVFFMSFPSVMPDRLFARALWGFAGGLICMFTRRFGFLEESVCFGILITDALSGFFDKIPPFERKKKKIIEEEVYEEIPPTVVPDEILSEIPDVPEQDEEEEHEEQIEAPAESESLESVISEENTVTETEAPFPTGGDDDE